MVDTTKKPNGAAGKNGTEKTPSSNAAASTPQPLAIVKEEKPTEQPQPLRTTIEEQRDKNEKLTILFEREERLKSTQKNLEKFKFAHDEDASMCEIKDNKGISFRTGHPVLIKKLIEVSREFLEGSIAKTEADIISIG